MKPAKHHILPHTDPVKLDSNPEYFVVYRKTKIKKKKIEMNPKKENWIWFLLLLNPKLDWRYSLNTKKSLEFSAQYTALKFKVWPIHILVFTLTMLQMYASPFFFSLARFHLIQYLKCSNFILQTKKKIM